MQRLMDMLPPSDVQIMEIVSSVNEAAKPLIPPTYVDGHLLALFVALCADKYFDGPPIHMGEQLLHRGLLVVRPS